MNTELDRCYAILGVGFGAPPDELKQAYRDLVREWHPDKHQSDERKQRIAEEKLKQINLAYERLRNYEPTRKSEGGSTEKAKPASKGYAAYETQWQGASSTSAGPRPDQSGDESAASRAQVHYAAGLAAFEAGDWTEAVSSLMQSVCLKPNIGNAYSLLGRAYTELNLPAKAASCFKQAVRFQPGNVDTQNELARSYLAMGEPKEAVWICTQVLKKRAKNVAIRSTLGRAYRKLGQTAQSLEALNGAISLDESYAPAHYELGETLLVMGQTEAARDVYANLKRLDADLAVQLLLSIVGR